MEINETQISRMVEDIARRVEMEMQYGKPSLDGPLGGSSTGVYNTIDECVKKAGIAQ